VIRLSRSIAIYVWGVRKKLLATFVATFLAAIVVQALDIAHHTWLIGLPIGTGFFVWNRWQRKAHFDEKDDS
jgi:hypothetical protein